MRKLSKSFTIEGLLSSAGNQTIGHPRERVDTTSLRLCSGELMFVKNFICNIRRGKAYSIIKFTGDKHIHGKIDPIWFFMLDPFIYFLPHYQESQFTRCLI